MLLSLKFSLWENFNLWIQFPLQTSLFWLSIYFWANFHSICFTRYLSTYSKLSNLWHKLFSQYSYYPFNIHSIYIYVTCVIPDINNLCYLSFCSEYSGSRFIHFVDLPKEPLFGLIYFSFFKKKLFSWFLSTYLLFSHICILWF